GVGIRRGRIRPARQGPVIIEHLGIYDNVTRRTAERSHVNECVMMVPAVVVLLFLCGEPERQCQRGEKQCQPGDKRDCTKYYSEFGFHVVFPLFFFLSLSKPASPLGQMR